MTSPTLTLVSRTAAVSQWVQGLAPDRRRLTSGRVARDLADRSVSGVLAYEFLLLIILLATPFPTEHSLLAAGFIGAALLVGLFRLFVIRELRRSGAHETRHWARAFHVGALLAAVVWSAFLCSTVRLYPWEWPMWLTLFCSSGLAAGAATSLSPDLTLTRRSLGVLFVPAIALLLADRSAQGLTLALVFGTYLAFLVIQTAQQFDVYWRGVRESEHLEARTVELHEMGLQQEEELETELERLRTHLLRVTRLETTSTLSTATAFELDRLATTLTGAVAVLAQAAADGQAPGAQALADVRQVEAQTSALAASVRAQGTPVQEDTIPVDLGHVVRTTLDSLQIARRARHVDLALDLSPTPVRVRATRASLELLLVNLVGHAIDAMEAAARPGRRLSVRVTGGGDEGADALVTLQDAGPGQGTGPALWASVFEADALTMPSGNAPPMGVVVARQVLERLGGRIAVAHSPGAGTTVTVSVPRA